AHQQQLALQPLDLCFPPPLLSCVHYGQGLFEDSQPFLPLSFLPICLGQLCQIPWSRQLRPRGTPGSHALAYLLTPLCCPSLCSQGPSPQDGSLRQPLGNPLLSRKGNGRFSPLLGLLSFTAQHTHKSCVVQGKGECKAVREGARLVKVVIDGVR